MLRTRCTATLRRSLSGRSVFERSLSNHVEVVNKNIWDDIEKKWQKRWSEKYKISSTKASTKPPYYCLTMFPYPSGNLHLGHVRVYSISDSLARMRRLMGYEVLHPIGWDSFGLPAENAAIERGISPVEWTEANIKHMKKQFKSLGISFDWDKEIQTSSPEYYKWTQWLFLQLYHNGLAIQKDALVNWDPIDNTVLANEQVDAQGRSWRSGALVEQKKLKQWFLKITDYAEELENDLKEINVSTTEKTKSLQVFTTQPQTLYGVSFIALSSDHPLLSRLYSSSSESFKTQITQFKEENSNNKRESTTRGLRLEQTAIHPLTKENLPIFIADYVLSDYGTGAVMGVPAHDERDYSFAQEHNLPIRPVITPQNSSSESTSSLPYPAINGYLKKSGIFTGMTTEVAKLEVIEYLEKKLIGKKEMHYRLKDWLVSRQRYWGAPVPIIHCKKCGVVPVPEEDLPVELPSETIAYAQEESSKTRTKQSGSPLDRCLEWKHVPCPSCGDPASRDTDTLDTFVDSSWYFLRYLDSKNSNYPFSKEETMKWIPKGVDLYIGGIEHAILHLLYSRFISKFLYKINWIPNSEPFQELLTQGMVLGKTYKSKENLRYLKSHEIQVENGIVIEKETKEKAVFNWEKMSKSKYNGVDPQELINEFGADVVRLTVLFKAPPSQDLEWDEKDMTGKAKWLLRIKKLIESLPKRQKEEKEEENSKKKKRDLNDDERKKKEVLKDLRYQINRIIFAVTDSMVNVHAFNVAIANLMKLSNILSEEHLIQECSETKEYIEGIESFLIMLSPLAPHFSSEMYEKFLKWKRNEENSLLLEDNDIHEMEWPAVDIEALDQNQIQVVLQVQGKTKGTIKMSKHLLLEKEQAIEYILKSDQGKNALEGHSIKKTIFVPPKGKTTSHYLVNFVI